MRFCPILFFLIVLSSGFATGADVDTSWQSSPTVFDAQPVSGEIGDGEAPDGEASDGEESDGDLPDQDLPDGDLPDQDLPDQDLPDGNLPSGRDL